MTRRTQDGLLIALAVLAALAIFFAFSNVRPGGVTSENEPTSPVTGTSAPTTMTTPPATSTAAPTATGTPPPTTTVEEPGDAPVETGDPLQTARDLLAEEPVVLVVLGDGTSNHFSEWVYLWAVDLGTDRPVQFHQWDEASGLDYLPVETISETGTGPAVTIWNGSMAAGTPARAAGLLPDLVPEQPDVIIYNYGHMNSVDNIGPQLTALDAGIRALHGEVPTLVTLQNPQVEDLHAPVRERIQEWAQENGVGVLDVAAEFPEPEWPWLVDDVYPGPEGQQRWAEIVAELLG